MQDLRISGSQKFPYSESDIRVNSIDRNKIIAAANASIMDAVVQGLGVFFSFDGGNTWAQASLPLNAGDAFQSDPTVDWTSDGTAWAITIGVGSQTDKKVNLTTLKLRCYKSRDGGATWCYDAIASGDQTMADKEMMCVDHDPHSPCKDNIYVIWHNDGPVFVNRRTGPSGSWRKPIQVSAAETTGLGIGGDIKTNRAGDVFAFWPDTGSRNIFVAKSANGGDTFGAPAQIATTFGSFQVGIPADNFRQAVICVSGGAYRTATKDLVYVVWTDLSGEAGCTSGWGPGSDVRSKCKSRIWFSRSTDGGARWEAARMINNQPSLNDQFFPRIAVDETNGQLLAVYYDTVGDPGRLKTDVWMQRSSDDGVTWSAAVKVTTAQTDETATGADVPGAGFGFGDQYGDYIGLSGYAGVFFSLVDRPTEWRTRGNLDGSHSIAGKLAMAPFGPRFAVVEPRRQS